MRRCFFCCQDGHTVYNCDSNMIHVFENAIRYNAAYDYYLGLQTTFLKLYLMSLNVNILRVIGYKHKILLKNHPIKNYYGRYLPYHKFVNLFVIHYSNVSMDEHIGLINAIPKSKIQIYSEYIHNFLRKSNVHTNWTPTSIATILMSTRVFNITFQPATRLQLTSGLDDCPICYEPIQPKYYCNLGCNHRFCSTCILTYINTLYISNVIQPICPLCRTDITNFTTPIENYKDCIHAISKIRNIEVIGDASEEHEAILNTENRLHVDRNKKGWIYVLLPVVRVYLFLVYADFIIAVVSKLFMTASSYRNPDRLQI
jgi:hypothetical protein